ncbi:MAG: LLM class flavin-dependent oxidoreductase, partial [Phycicoccus sp.]
TLQQLSGGRMVLGVGVGWSEPEFDAVGAEFARRGAATDETLALLGHLFSGGSAPFRAGRLSYEHGVFAPVPDTRPPVMVGGNSDAALRRAARYGDIWQGIPADPASFAQRVQRLGDLAAGRHVVAAARIGWDDGAPLEQVAETALAYRAAGAAEVAIHVGDHRGAAARMESLAVTLRDA